MTHLLLAAQASEGGGGVDTGLLLVAGLGVAAFVVGHVTRRWISEVIVFIAIGILIGPEVFNVVTADILASLDPLISVSLGAIVFGIGERLELPVLRQLRSTLAPIALFENLFVLILLLVGPAPRRPVLLGHLPPGGDRPVHLSDHAGRRDRGAAGQGAIHRPPAVHHRGQQPHLRAAVRARSARHPRGPLDDRCRPGRRRLRATRGVLAAHRRGGRVRPATMDGARAPPRRAVAVRARRAPRDGGGVPGRRCTGGHLDADRRCGAGQRSRDTRPLFAALRTLEAPIFLVFFVVAGAAVHLDELATVGIPGIVYVLGRSLGKWGGGWLGAEVTRAGRRAAWGPWIGMGLSPFAGMAIGLAAFTLEKATRPGCRTSVARCRRSCSARSWCSS